MNAEILPTEAERLTGGASASARCQSPVAEHWQEGFGDAACAADGKSLEAIVVGLLRERGLTISLAESCTGGLISKRITDIDGASAVYKGGVNVYTNEAKTVLLGVLPELIEDCGVISAAVAVALSENVRRVLKSDFGIGVTGLAGPGDDGKNPVGTVFVAMACEGKSYVSALSLGERGGREGIREAAADHALYMVRRFLVGLEVTEP